MEREQLLAWFLVYRRMKKRRRNRMQWVHPINLKRNESGAFHVLFQELRNGPIKFYNYFRMSISTFDELHGRLKDSLQRHNTFFRECIQPTQMLVVAISHVGTCPYITALGSVSAAFSMAREMLSSLSFVRRSSSPSASEGSSLPTDIVSSVGRPSVVFFRNCSCCPYTYLDVGCLPLPDVKEALYLASGCTFTDLHYSYRLGISTISKIVKDGFSSVVLMAVADSDYRFIYVDVGSYGKDCDSNIFKASSMWKSIVNKELEIPEEKCPSGRTGTKVPYFLVGDEAFALHRHLLRPYGGNNLTVAKRIFNYRLSRARRVST
ncbi:hypothetical protein J437_LFUL003117 [Ladona fulva]|uniref:DDE Tnp4 domain-containing protein n=1 Tax=Ladona fulva TaxID=123851 RepID=A0A8K0JXK2_LADFU|nr:hypothetical protein J437_LFUL003117 [Ladona fulva]